MSRFMHSRFFVAMVLLSAACPSAVWAKEGRDPGVAIVPADAAFLSATLRVREQLDAILASRSYQAIRKLPAVERAIKAFEDEKSVPASPLSVVVGVLERPENTRAVELVQDLLSSDTFVYGEPSCTTFAQLLQKLQEANQVAGILRMIERPGRSIGGFNGGGFDIDGLDIDLDTDEDDEDDGAAIERDGAGIPVRPVRLRSRVVAEREAVEDLAVEDLGERLLLDAVVDNLDSLVIPDVVWGFRTTKPELAAEQLRRLDELPQIAAALAPGLGLQSARQPVAGHDFLTVTLPGSAVPWEDLGLGRFSDDPAKIDKVVERLEALEIVVAIGIIGDRVVLSIGDSLEHLEKLAKVEPGAGLLSTDAFRPLAKKAAGRLTGISYVSEPMARALAPSVAYLRRLADLSGKLAAIAGDPAAEDDIRKLLDRIATDSEKRLPVPGAWLGFSSMNGEGYEGEVWDWSTNVPLDGSKPLGLFEHAGGAPLGAAVFRVKNDPAQFDEIVSWIEGVRGIVSKYVLDDEDREQFGRLVGRFGPLASKLAGIVRKKLLPSLADGQIGFVLDAKSRVERLHEALPAGGEPLPLVEPAIVLGVSSPAVFQEGINDLFALADEFVEKVREAEPDAVPEGYRIPEPERTKVDAGTIWSFALPDSGLDAQIRPSIALGKDAVVFTLVPKQAARLLSETKLETGSQLAALDDPAAAGAALDCAGVLDAIEPWVVYGIRYAAALRSDGSEVDPSLTLDADVEDEQARDVVSQVKVVFNSLKCLRAAAAKMSMEGDARVTRWRNVIRDIKEE